MSAAANAVTVEKAYEAFEKLDANAAEAESSYLLLLDGVKGEPKVKQLCAQFIPRFFGKFPKLQENALNAILDLCEDESNVIRLNAIPALAEICKASPKHTKQIADVMAQLLISEASELALVKKNFTSLFKLDAKVAFESLFQQVREGEENLRANCLTFLKEQIGEQKANIATDESLQKSIADGVKSVMGAENGVSSDELKSFIEVLRGLKIYSTDKELPSTVAAIIASQAGLQKPFEPTNDAAIQNLISCVQMAARLNPPRARRPKSAAESKEEVKEEENKTVDNSAFLLFFKDKILPVFAQVSEPNKLSLLKTFADAARSATANTAAALFPHVVELVKVYASGEAAAAAAAESAVAEPSKPTPISAGTPGPKINYSLVEALLVLFHRLGSKNHNSVKEVAGLFTPTGQPSDFRPALREKREALVNKLKVAVDSVGPYLTSLKAVSQKLKEKRQESKDDAEKKNISEKLTSLNLANRTAENVNRLASALMKASPEIINLVPSSWGARPPKKGPAGSVAGKKRTGSTGPAGAGQKRTKGDTSANNAGSKRSNSQTRGGGSARGRRGGGNKRVNTGGNNNSGGAGQGTGSRSNSRGRSGPRGRGRGRGRRGQ